MHTRSITPTAAVFMLAIALVACGKRDGADAASSGGGMAVADDTGGLKKPRKDCGRARRLLAETPPGPVQDVLGIRTGTSEADAFALLSCNAAGYTVTLEPSHGFGIADVPGVDPAEATLKAEFNESCGEMECTRDVVTAVLVGPPGQRRVLAVKRLYAFNPARQNTVANLRTELTAKYGTPYIGTEGRYEGDLFWFYRVSGGRVPDGDPALTESNGCRRLSASGYPNTEFIFAGDCGPTVMAEVRPEVSSPALVDYFTVSAGDQAQAISILQSTQSAYAGLMTKAKAQEAERAGQSGDRPQF